MYLRTGSGYRIGAADFLTLINKIDMKKLKETTFENVVLGALVITNGASGQKIDEPIGGGKNQYGQDRNMSWSEKGMPSNLDKDTVVKTTHFSLKDRPDLRHT